MGQAKALDRRLSIRSASVYIDKSETALRKLIARGFIVATKARDGSIRIALSELDSYLTGDPVEDQGSSSRAQLTVVPSE